MPDQPVQDPSTVTASGEARVTLPDGVTFRRATTHIDERGSVCEMFDTRWHWHPDPLVFAYMFTLRPGMAKGWGLHERHDDRYFIVSGEMEVVLYDVRPDSRTRNEIAKVVLSEYDRRLMCIPAGIWHASRNLGGKDALVVNFPTQPYDHDHPDKVRLPLDTDAIPFRFDQGRGW